MKKMSTIDDLNVTLVQLAANYVKGSRPELDEVSRSIAVKNASLFGRILPLVEAFLRAPNENSSVAVLSDSFRSLKLSSSSTEKCVDILTNVKSGTWTDSSLHQEHHHTLSDMKWRVDITISSSVLSRVFEPTIIMELVLSNRKKITFEISVSKFHKLRYTVASILKEMDHMSNRMSAVKV